MMTWIPALALIAMAVGAVVHAAAIAYLGSLPTPPPPPKIVPGQKWHMQALGVVHVTAVWYDKNGRPEFVRYCWFDNESLYFSTLPYATFQSVIGKSE